MTPGPSPHAEELGETLVRVSLSLPRDARYVTLLRNLAQCVLGDLGAPADAIDDIGIALTEACANVVHHAEGVREYSVTLAAGTLSCHVEVTDDGPGFDPDEANLRTPAAPTAEDGRGLFVIQTLVDELRFDRERGGTSVRLVKRWNGLELGLPGDNGGQRGDSEQALVNVEIDHPDGQ